MKAVEGVFSMEEKEKKKLKGFFSYLKKTYAFAKQDKKYLIFFLIGSIFYCAISVIAPLLTAKRIVSLTSELWTQLIIITIAIFAIEILRNFVRYFDNCFMNRFFYSVKKNIQLEVAKETLKTNMDTLNHNTSGLFIERINNDSDTLSDVFVVIVDYITFLLSNIGVFISIFFLNKIIFLIYLLFLLILFFGQKYAADKIQEKRKVVKKKKEETSGFISELVRGAHDIKILNAENSFLDNTKNKIEDLGNASITAQRTRARFQLLNGSIRDILDFLVMMTGIGFILHGNLEIATMIIILSYRGNIMSISSNFENFLDNLKRFNLSAEKIFDVIEGEKFPKEKFGTKHLQKAEGNIEFKNVSFQYDEEQDVLKKVSFKIVPNETVSFVGKSGSGKSTIFNLIAGLYYPSDGQILIDGIPITELDKNSIRGNLSIISQNPYIFNMSIRENLQIIKEDLTEEEMVEACKMACLHDFILTLKDGYDTVVGESGVTLSGGQRQRLAIARALVQKTEIILFDEATSALDNETQAEIQKSIQNMQGEYTILIIAHRLSTVINSNRILLVDKGKIVASGTHQELLAKNKVYQNLYELELKEQKENNK